MIDGASSVPAILLAVVLVALVTLRSRPAAIRIPCEAALLALIGGTLLHCGISLLPVAGRPAQTIDTPWLRALTVVWWLIAARLIATLTALGLGRDARSRQARLFSDLLAGGIYLTAVLIILNSVLDFPIKTLLATSGVIAIVLGLALQNTLADLFSGIAVGVEQPFHLGDRISIGDHAEGVVVEMNWRSIRVQTDGEDVATIPNSIVARNEIINRSFPTERRAASLEIPTLSTARSEILIELVRQAVLLCPDILVEPAPHVLLKHIGTRSTTIGVSFFVASTSALGVARSQLLRQARRLFRHAGVVDGEAETAVSLLRNLALFATLSTDQIERLAKATTELSYEPGDLLMQQGVVGSSLYVIRFGIFEVRKRHEDGDGVTVYGRIGPGEYLGEISMMSGDPRPVSVVSLSSGGALELPRAALESLLREDHGLSVALERSIRRGLALLDRDDAARACHPLDHGGSILARIRAFLGAAGRTEA